MEVTDDRYVGDAKFGKHVGTDQFGNRFFENVEYGEEVPGELGRIAWADMAGRATVPICGLPRLFLPPRRDWPVWREEARWFIANSSRLRTRRHIPYKHLIPNFIPDHISQAVANQTTS